MKTIRVRYMGPSNTRPARFVVTDGKRHLRISYQYENQDQEAYQAAVQFVTTFMPRNKLTLNPEPATFNGDLYYTFRPEWDPEKFGQIGETILNQMDFTKPITKSKFKKIAEEMCKKYAC